MSIYIYIYIYIKFFKYSNFKYSNKSKLALFFIKILKKRLAVAAN